MQTAIDIIIKRATTRARKDDIAMAATAEPV